MATHLLSASLRRHAAPLLLGLCVACASTQAEPGPAAPSDVAPSGAPQGAAAPAVVPSPPLPLNPEIVSGRLENGLTYFLQRHQSADKRAHLVLVVKAGSVYEAADQRGFAHFVEHMAFNGTRHFEKASLVDFFEKSGLTFGSHTNASTSFDRTLYRLSLPTDKPELLSTALDVLVDWAGGLSFDPNEIQKERPVLLSEWTSSQGAARRVGEQHRKLLLAGSLFAERDVIGERAVLESGPAQRLIDFYRTWYRPERMAVSVVGDIDTAAVEAALRQRFAALPPSAAPAPAEPPLSVPIRPQPVFAVITDPETTSASVSVIFKKPARPARTEADTRDQLKSYMTTLLLRRRLEALAEDPSAPFTGAGSSAAPGVFGVLDLIETSARAKQGKVQASLDVLLREIERVKRHGFVDSELTRMKTEFRRGLERAVQAEPTSASSAIAMTLANQFVSGGIYTSARYDLELGTRLLAELTTAQLNEEAKRWYSTGEELIIASGPSRDAMPAQAELTAALTASERAPVDPYVDRVASVRLLAALPEPGRVVKEEAVPEVGLTVWTLSNGARVVLKPTDFEDDRIIGHAISFGGNSRASDKDYPKVRFTSEIVSNSGLGELDRQTLIKALTGRVASALPWIDEASEGVRMSTSPKDAETMFQLAYLYFTAPRRDPAVFETLRGALRENIRNRDLSPERVFGDAVTQALWGGQLRRSPPTLASVDQIDLDQSLAFYRERFSDVGDVSFVFVGDLDPQTFRPLVERYLASLPGHGRKEKYRDLGLHMKKGVTTVRVNKGREDKALAVLMFHGESKWSDPAHTDLVSLQSYLQIRLREVLREEMGGVYTPGVSASFERVPFDNYALTISYNCKPADLDALEQATRRVIAETKNKGPDQSYVTKLVNQRTVEVEEYYRSNTFWLQRLATAFERGDDPKQILNLHELTKRVTSENIKLAAQKYLKDSQYLDARLTPESTPATTPPSAGPGQPPTGPGQNPTPTAP